MTTIFLSTLLAFATATEPTQAPSQETTLEVHIPIHARATQHTVVLSGDHRSYENLIESMRSFEIIRAVRFAERLYVSGSPNDRLAGFMLAIRTQAWREAIGTDGAMQESAIKILKMAKDIRASANEAGPLASPELDDLVGELDVAIASAYDAIQRIRSEMHNPSIDRAFEQLDDARPWWWFNSSRGEIEAGRLVTPAFRDRYLVDLRTESRIDEFVAEAVGGLGQDEREPYLRKSGLSSVKPRHPDLIPEENRVWDASSLALPTTVDAQLNLMDRNHANTPEAAR